MKTVILAASIAASGQAAQMPDNSLFCEELRRNMISAGVTLGGIYARLGLAAERVVEARAAGDEREVARLEGLRARWRDDRVAELRDLQLFAAVNETMGCPAENKLWFFEGYNSMREGRDD